MTYHEFLRAVWKAANHRPVTFESFDNAVLPALRRMNSDLHDEVLTAVCTIDPVSHAVSFRTTELLSFLERSWKAPAESTT